MESSRSSVMGRPSTDSTQYASVHRSATSRRPFLSLKPVTDSLTEGTDIPPPPPVPAPLNTKVGSFSSEEEELSSASKRQLEHGNNPSIDMATATKNPLQSNPVTPVDTISNYSTNLLPRPTSSRYDSSVGEPFPTALDTHADGTSTVTPSTSRRHYARPSEPISHDSLTQHEHNDLPDPWASAPQSSRRRSSLAMQLLRFRAFSARSINSIRGIPNPPSEPISRTTQTPSRPPSRLGQFFSANERTPQPRPELRTRATSATFPRLMRQKSVELLGTARRRSGFWGRGDEVADVDMLLAQEQAREEAMERDRGNWGNSGEARGRSVSRLSGPLIANGPVKEGRYVSGEEHEPEESKEEEMENREPPPSIPALKSADGLDGQMFATIGRGDMGYGA